MINDDIELASFIIERNKKDDKNKLVLCERENVNKYIDYLNGKTLTYDPSFDISLSMIQKGINDITVVGDVLSVYYLYLKQAGIITFDYQQFIDFLFHVDWKKQVPFDESYYNALRDNLYKINKRAAIFWNFMYDNYGYNFLKVYPSTSREYNNLRYRLFRNKKIETGAHLPYLKDEDSYNLLKNNIRSTKITYISGNILKYNFETTFDSIVISKELELKKAENKLSRYLNKDGVLLYSTKKSSAKVLVHKR